MRFALHSPNFGSYSDPVLLAELAHDAEEAGWDGYFLWDHFFWGSPRNQPVADPWVALAAMSVATKNIRLGTLITPLPRRRPWTVARQAATLDHLSLGRAVLGVGIGGDWFGDYTAFGEVPDDKIHGQMLDEALAVICGLWKGEPFSFSGHHYEVKDAHFLPRAVQEPRIPVWVAGNWPNKKPFRRAAEWDAIVPEGRSDYGDLQPDDYVDILSFISQYRRSKAPFDVVHGGETPRDNPAEAASIVASYADAGVTWWLERITDQRGSLLEMRERICIGPPRY